MPPLQKNLSALCPPNDVGVELESDFQNDSRLNRFPGTTVGFGRTFARLFTNTYTSTVKKWHGGGEGHTTSDSSAAARSISSNNQDGTHVHAVACVSDHLSPPFL
jgi:hypothetical protein